jgi:hypothetical protein
MHKPVTAHVFYNYDEDRCILHLHYDRQKNEITITGGRHGFARLAELFAIFAQLSVSCEDSNWFSVSGDHHQLIVVLDDELRKD